MKESNQTQPHDAASSSSGRVVRLRLRKAAIAILVSTAVVVFAIDQFVKYLVVQNLPLHEYVSVFGQWLQFFYVRNPGAAFSIGSGQTWIFSIIGLAVLGFIIWFAPRIRSLLWGSLFGLLLGGLLGNLADRLFRSPGFGVGEVVDFIKIPLLPAFFNIADMAIVCSMALFLILVLMGRSPEGAARHDEARSVAESDGEQKSEQ